MCINLCKIHCNLNQTFIFRIQTNFLLESNPAFAFSINPQNGRISLNNTLDRESIPKYILRVKVCEHHKSVALFQKRTIYGRLAFLFLSRILPISLSKSQNQKTRSFSFFFSVFLDLFVTHEDQFQHTDLKKHTNISIIKSKPQPCLYHPKWDRDNQNSLVLL